MGSDQYGKKFADFKIISSESKSWYIGKPGTNIDSFSVTWSPGAIVLYGSEGNITLIFSAFSSYEKAKKWLAGCSLDEFTGAIAHNHPENLDYFYYALKHWGGTTHYK